ncbi:54cb39ce-b1d3-4004-9478-6d6ec86be6d8 [Thermothielavioides terrestris]|nr:54cb39ce-b1d3-4004-9478-6d6ec86be6d8 [Thermothielavioides terrestris]
MNILSSNFPPFAVPIHGPDRSIDLNASQLDRVREKVERIGDRLNPLEVKAVAIDAQLGRLKEKVDGIGARLKRLESQFDRVVFENTRMAARFQNSTLKNPALPIAPLPALHPVRGIVHPDLSQFPRHAKEFYALRHPSNDRQRRMLSYLISFYDIRISAAENSDDEVGADPDERAVEMLEAILGLNEDNFIRFRERAREPGRPSAPPAIKRSSSPALEVQDAKRRRPKREPRQ